MEENDNGRFLGKLFKGYVAYKVISYPFKRNKNLNNKKIYDLEFNEDYDWEEEQKIYIINEIFSNNLRS